MCKEYTAITLLASCSEYLRDQAFLLTMVSYLKKKESKRKKKSHVPFQSYLLTGQADSAKKAKYLSSSNNFLN